MGRSNPQAQARFDAVLRRIRAAEHEAGRPPGGVTLLAVSKGQPAESIRDLFQLGQRAFGENYASEAVQKMNSLALTGAEWHFIGPVQSNKTRVIADRFDWVHSVDREKIARRLGQHRDPARGPLNICIQVNISAEPSKSGVSPDQVAALARTCTGLENLKLRGLMAIPAPDADFHRQRGIFEQLGKIQQHLNDQGLNLDTLSMGMSADLEAAIAAGSTIVRVGTAVFGPRKQRPGP